MKWKDKQNDRIIEVLGDEVVNGKKYRFYSYCDNPNAMLEWDLIYGLVWEENFEPLTASVKSV